MARKKTVFACIECGYETPRWIGNCPACRSWNTLVERLPEPDENASASKHRANIKAAETDAPVPRKLSEINPEDMKRIPAAMPEFDRVLGGGMVPGSFILIGGDPGIGKSTLALQLAGNRDDLNILYCSGEESAGQIRGRAERMQVKSDHLSVYPETDMNRILHQIESLKPDVLIIDSIQTVYRPELQSMPGTVAQIRECAGVLMRLAKQMNMVTMVIGHVTKEGDIAGPRVLEHMVDVVLQFEGDKNLNYRLLRSLKNRFGRTHEIGVFEMLENGLRNVDNPSELFLSGFTGNVSGNAAACIMEGNRPILLEIQALVTPASYGTPQRTASGFDHRRLSLLLAVLEKRSGFRFGDKDVFVNAAGGMKLSDTASDLALVSALVSSLLDKPIPEKTLLIGEVGLGAEIRQVSGLEERIREAQKSGFETVIVPAKTGSAGSKIPGGKKVNTAADLHALFRVLFGNG